MSVYHVETSEGEMKREAVRRLQLLKLSEAVVQSFQQEDQVYFSEEAEGEILLRPSDGKLMEQIAEFQKEYQCLVYHAILNYIPGMGEIWSLLFVSPTSSDWEGEREELSGCGLVYAYVISDMETGIGEIVVEPAEEGLRRVG